MARGYISLATPNRCLGFFIPHVGGSFTASGLRHSILTASLRICGYSHQFAFQQVCQYPLKLTQGNIDNNIAELEEHVDHGIADPTTLQFRNALHCGWSADSARDTLEVVLDATCSTSMVEQGHGVSSACKNDVKLGGLLHLQSRSMVHQCRGFFGSTVEEKQLQRIDRSIVKLERRLKKRFRGREYIAARLTAQSVRRCNTPRERLRVARLSIKKRHSVYDRLRPAAKVSVERKANAEKKETECSNPFRN